MEPLFSDVLDYVSPFLTSPQAPSIGSEISACHKIGFKDQTPEIPQIEPNIYDFNDTLPTMAVDIERDLITGDIVSFKDLPISTFGSDVSNMERQASGYDNYHKGNVSTGLPLFVGNSVKKETLVSNEELQRYVASLSNGINLLVSPFLDEIEDKQEELPEIADIQFDINDKVNPVTLYESNKVEENKKFNAILDNWDTSKFHEKVSNPAYEFKFKLDDFQARAIYRMEKGYSVFVSAPTSAGKTLIAQYAIAMCRKHKTRAIYTSPIKALSNQKFRQFSMEFNDVGILTGDVSLNREASVLIMTTEILRSMLYKGADILRDVEYVIFDECHYLSDDERGVVWEESIILMPPHIKMVFLSATAPNDLEITKWISRTKQIDVYLERHVQRPIPLAHSLYVYDKFFEISNQTTKFDEKKLKNARIYASQNYSNYSSNILFTNDFWYDFVNNLKKSDYLPSLIFCFSIKNLERYASFLSNINLLNGEEKRHVKGFCYKAISRIPPQDRKLKQIETVFKLLENGIGIHHGGILPILKEIVEILLADGYVKVLFCTSTFQMGINAPVRTCCFTSLTKFNGKENVNLSSTEYIQMSGRAGRRGLDTVGRAIVICSNNIPDNTYLHEIYGGSSEKLESQFHIRFNMILSLIRVQGISIKDLLKKSLSANALQSEIPKIKETVSKIEKELQDIEDIDCSLNQNQTMTKYVEDISEAKKIIKMYLDFAGEGGFMRFLSKPGRVVLYLNQYLQVGIIDKINLNDKKPIKIKNPSGVISSHTLNDIICGFANVFLTKEAKFRIKLTDKFLVEPLSEIEKGIKSYEFKEISNSHMKTVNRIIKSPCFECSQNSSHYSIEKHKFDLIQKKDKYYKQYLNENSSELNNLLNKNIELLQDMGYVSSDRTITLKGRISLEFGQAHELICTELLFSNFFENKTPAQIAALASCLVAQRIGNKNKSEDIPNDLIEPVDEMIECAENVQKKMDDFDIPFDNEEFIQNNVNYNPIHSVYEWALGKDFVYSMKFADSVQEGSMVRLITQTNDLLKNFSSASKLIGSITLFEKFETARESISRDIIFASSLYLD